MYTESVESRRDITEEYARIFYCTQLVDEADKPAGPIVKTFDALWDLSEEVIQWLQIEVYTFFNGINDEMRNCLSE